MKIEKHVFESEELYKELMDDYTAYLNVFIAIAMNDTNVLLIEIYPKFRCYN